MKRRLCWVAFVVSSTFSYASPVVFPEDGSRSFTTWVTSETSLSVFEDPKAFETFLLEQGVRIERLPIDYDWIQDLSFSFNDGSIALLPVLGGLVEGASPSQSDRYKGLWGFRDPAFLQDMTLGVVDEEQGWLRIHPKHLADRSWVARRLSSSVIEGGDLISGTDADGAAYALVDRSTLDRTGAVLNSQDETETRLALAKDLGVALNRLLVLDMGGHLDTQIKALPGGVVLIQDPTRIVETMELLSARSESGSLEQRTYERVARIYRDGHQRYDHAGRPIGTPSRPWGSSSEAQLAAAIALLQSDPALRVVPVMGQFGDLSDERRSWIWDWRNNFFNAMTGLTPDGRVFWVGNRTRMASKPAGRLPQLEAYWSEVLRQHGVDPDLIRFWGRFDGAGGVNCTGFPKP